MVAPPAVSPSDPALPSSPLPGSLSAPLPGSPTPRRTRRPRWLDLRLVLGVVLVLGSVLLGAVVVSRAQASTAVWSLRRDLPAGSVLAVDDLTPVDVRLGDTAGSYVRADSAVVGRRLTADLGRGQLLPAAALGGTGDDGRVTVSIPFASADVPSVARGDRLTVWVSTPTCASVVLLRGVAVQNVGEPGSGLTASDGLEVVVTVSPELADRIVGALALDDVTLRAGVLSGGASRSGSGTTDGDLPDLAACAPAGSAVATPTPTAS